MSTAAACAAAAASEVGVVGMTPDMDGGPEDDDVLKGQSVLYHE